MKYTKADLERADEAFRAACKVEDQAHADLRQLHRDEEIADAEISHGNARSDFMAAFRAGQRLKRIRTCIGVTYPVLEAATKARQAAAKHAQEIDDAMFEAQKPVIA